MIPMKDVYTITDDIAFLTELADRLEESTDGRTDSVQYGVKRLRGLVESLIGMKKLMANMPDEVLLPLLFGVSSLDQIPHCGDPTCDPCNERCGPTTIPPGQVN